MGGKKQYVLVFVLGLALVGVGLRQSAATMNTGAVPVPGYGAYFGIAPDPTAASSVTNDLEDSIGRSFNTERVYSSTANPDILGSSSAVQNAIAHNRIPWLSITTGKWDQVASGQKDRDIDSLAQQMLQLGQPIFLTVNYEPEDEVANHYSVNNYVAAWQRYHDRFASQGVTNVSWSYVVKDTSLKNGDPLYANATGMYPGDSYVDWIGVDSYNMRYDVNAGYDYCKAHGAHEPKAADTASIIRERSKYPCQADRYVSTALTNDWHDLSARIDPAYQWVTAGKPGIHTKPMAVAEWGSTWDWRSPGRRADWITAAKDQLKHQPAIKLIAYANRPEWKLGWPPDQQTGSDIPAFKTMGEDLYYHQTLPIDATKPTVTLTQPESGTYSGVVTAEAVAEDNVAIDHVSFLANDTWLHTDYIAPYTYDRDTSTNSGGNYAIKAVAFDTTGNSTASTPVAITVDNRDTNPPTINSFTATPSRIKTGENTLLEWTTANAAGCSVTPDGPQDTLSASWMTPPLMNAGTVTYTLTCTNEFGSVDKNVSITVEPITQPPGKPTFTSNAAEVEPGSDVMLSWSSENAQSCDLNPGQIHAIGSSGSQLIENMKQTTTYTLGCNNAAGTTVADPLTVTVTREPETVVPHITLFAFNPEAIDHQGTTILSSRVSGAAPDGCTIVGTPYYSISGNFDVITPPLDESHTLTEICSSATQHTATAVANVSVNGAPPPPPPSSVTPEPPPVKSETEPDSIVDAASQVSIVNSHSKAVVVRGAKITLTPVALTKHVSDTIERVEYYANGKLIQTVEDPPFALDTAPLKPGTYSITERIYSVDGFVMERTQQITVRAPRLVWIAPLLTLTLIGACAILATIMTKRAKSYSRGQKVAEDPGSRLS